MASLADYFEENNLIQENEHSVQLTSDPMDSDDPAFVLKMILNEEYKRLPEEESENLDLLELDIKEKVFNGLNFRIEVCDFNFAVIK